MVSPANKDGWPVEVSRAVGSRMILTSIGAFAGSEPHAIRGVNGLPDNGYVVERSPQGWNTAPFLEPPNLFSHSFEPELAVSSDLKEGLFEYNLLENETPHEQNLYVSTLPSGLPYQVGPVFSTKALARNPVNTIAAKTSISSASDDLATVVFAIEGPSKGEPEDYLWRAGDTTGPADTTVKNTGPLYGVFGFMSLYEFRGTGNSAPTLVGTRNDGNLIGQCGVGLGFPTEGKFDEPTAVDAYNVISSDGSHVFFTVAGAKEGPSGNACTDEGAGYGPSADELFARVHNEATAKDETISISEPSLNSCMSCNTSEPADAVYQGASKDGSKVFFLSEQKLLPGAEGENLYEYNLGAEAEGRESGKLLALIAPRVPGVARVSEDGSHVYFVSEDQLTVAPNPVGDTARLGTDNLYVYGEGQIAFVGTLSGADGEDWQRADVRPVDATPDGLHVAFDSAADLTHEDTRGVREVFEYGAQSGALPATLVRVSTSSGGSQDQYGAETVRRHYEGSQDPAPRLGAISDDGMYTVFESRDALTPEAAAGYTNVYEYHDGAVSLISDGQDRTGNTSLLGIDGSGGNIFFTSVDRLVPQDGDTQMDVYDARANGGFPASSTAASCEGDGCQGELSPTPMSSAVGSTDQVAGENVVESIPQHTATKVKKTKFARKAKAKRGARRRARGARNKEVSKSRKRPPR